VINYKTFIYVIVYWLYYNLLGVSLFRWASITNKEQTIKYIGHTERPKRCHTGGRSRLRITKYRQRIQSKR
jgi:hypothetical protein